MKAADARRQRLEQQRKRLRHADACDDGHSDARCHLAERLRRSAHEAPAAHEAALAASRLEIARCGDALATLDELQRWTERLVEVQMMWVDCSARLAPGAARRVWDRIDALLRRVATENGDAPAQLARLHTELPALVAEAAALAEAEPPARTQRPVRGRVELTYQWIPRVLRDICDSVEREHAAGRCRPALVDATRRIQRVVRDRNPYAYLQVVYRPPPDRLGGGWVLGANPQTDAIARLLHADFEQLRDFAWWMEKPDASFWKTFARLLRCVRRVAAAFHHVVVQLYAAAMRRLAPSVTADDVEQQIEASLAAHASFRLQTDDYGLAPWFATASDAIFHETFAMFPEVLVYVDAWRREFTIYEHGFAPAERARDYEVGFHKWKSSKAWLEIAHQSKRVAQAWRRSRLGSRSFEPMTIQQLGQLEKDIKIRLGTITDLLYRQNLAKWSQQRYQHSRARVLMELQILADSTGIQTSDATKVVKAEVDDVASSHEASRTMDKCFRAPTCSMPSRRGREGHGPFASEMALAAVAPVDEDSILKWTDDDIDAHEQETERLYELQGSMLSASDALSLSRLFSSELENEDPVEVLDDQTVASGLSVDCGRLRGVVTNIISRGEEIALHSAAEALIQRPSLRVTAGNNKDFEDEEIKHGPLPTDKLEAAIRERAVRFLNLHQAAAADPDAYESAQTLALDALALLRRAQHLVIE